MIITLECLYLTSTILLVVVAAVSHVQTAVVTVAGLGVEVEDDVVGGDVPGADLTVGVLAVTTLTGGPAAPQECSRGPGHSVITSQGVRGSSRGARGPTRESGRPPGGQGQKINK